MAKTISEQIEELESENQRLRNLEKIIEKIIKNEFGIGSKSIHKLIKNSHIYTDFLTKISDFYGLETDQDYKEFLDAFCTEEFISYFQNNTDSESSTAEA